MGQEFHIPADQSASAIGLVGFEPAFSVTLVHSAVERLDGPHGARLYRAITGGTVKGRLSGTVYPQGGGDYSLLRPDGTTDISAHILLRDPAGEWIYLRNQGFLRAQGDYYRVTSWVDADVRGKHSWVLGLFFIGTGRIAPDGLSTRIDYYEVT